MITKKGPMGKGRDIKRTSLAFAFLNTKFDISAADISHFKKWTVISAV